MKTRNTRRRLSIAPISLKEANSFVARLHRHSAAVVGHKFSASVYFDGKICGVVIVGRPLSRHLDNGATLEVLRLCTDGTANASSKLYGTACRAAAALGYSSVITYTLELEGGSSLRASGFTNEGEAGGGSWATAGRRSGAPLLESSGLADPRKHDKGKKVRWRRVLRRELPAVVVNTASQ
jgi:hypothetical protein